MNNIIKKSFLFIAFYLTTSSFIIFSHNLEEMLSTIAQQVHVITQNKGTDPVVSKQRTAARKEINSILSELKKDKELTRDATLLGTHVRKLVALAVKNEDTTNLENDIAQNLQIIAQKKINNLEKQITEVVGQEETARSTQIRAMLNNLRIRAYNAAQWAIAPIYPGYHSTPEEKAAAQEMITQLESRKNLLNADLQNPNLTRVERTNLRMQITQIDDEIYQQKIITGEEWTKQRKAIVRGAGVVGATAGLAGLGYYTYRPREPQQPQQKKETEQEKISLQQEISKLTQKISSHKKGIENLKEKKPTNWMQTVTNLENNLEKFTTELAQKKQELQQLQAAP